MIYLATLLFMNAFPIVAWADDRAPVPPMGWMDWEAYRCNVNEALIRNTTDAMVSEGWLKAGYDSVHIDDCWPAMERDSKTHHLLPDPVKFPSGIKALADYVHSKGLKLGLYSSASPRTCAGYPGSEGHEDLDAATFEEWGVDYLKFDACQKDLDKLETSYFAMGKALNNTKIVYACSWGASLGGNWPFAKFVAAGCDLWRLWHDIEAKKGWSDVVRISEHWAEEIDELRPWSGPPSTGRGWHDPDQLIAGDPQYSDIEAVTQFALWSILSAPLIMGNRLVSESGDPVKMSPEVQAAMQNPEAIAIARDPLAKMGGRLGSRSPGDEGSEIWVRELSNTAVAVLLWNKETPTKGKHACSWEFTSNLTASNSPSRMVCLKGASFNYTQWECCSNPQCETFSFSTAGHLPASHGSGCLYNSTDVKWTNSSENGRWILNKRPALTGASVTVQFSDLLAAGIWNLTTAHVRDVFAQKDLGIAKDSFTAVVPYHGVTLLKFTK